MLSSFNALINSPPLALPYSATLTHVHIRRTTLSRQASRGLVGAGVVAAGVSACAAAGAAAGSFAGAAGAATAMVPRGVRGVQKTVQVLEWTAGAAALAFTLADMASMVVTRSPVERNRIQSSSRSIVPVTVD